jgi:carbon storage regulator
MLVLSRKEGQQIIIDGHIILTVTEIGHNKVRIGVNAPKGMPVDRMEIHQLKQQGQQQNGEQK